jgi:hypothetical protein
MSTSHLLRSLWCAAAPIAALALLTTAASASAAPLPLALSSTIDAPYYTSLAIQDARAAIIGDFNGDGIDDHAYGTNDSYVDGELRVVFGAPGAVDGGGGVRFTGAKGATGDYVVDGAGDVDGDGFDDLVVQQTAPASRAFIVYGAASTPASTPLDAGPRITSLSTGTPGSPTVEGIGDFNGDGFDDVAIAQGTGAAATLNPLASQAIILGGPRVRTLNPLVRSSRVSILKGTSQCQDYYFVIPICSTVLPRLTGVGDFNGDGMDDVVIDSIGPAGRHIVLGRTGTFAASANSPGANSVSLTARVATTQRGEPAEWRKIVGAGDLNGDGFADLVIPISRLDREGNQWALLLGGPNPPAAVAATAPVILLGKPNDVFASQAAGDQNGDGRDDLFVVGIASAAVVSLPAGASQAAALDLSTFPQVNVQANYTVSDFDGPGDLDGDGAPDLIGTTGAGLGIFTHAYQPPAPVYLQCAPTMIPNKFRASEGAMLSVPASCAGLELRIAYLNSNGNVAQRYPTLAPGETQTPFDVDLSNPLLVPDTYTVTVMPSNKYGNVKPLSSTFEILPEATPPATTPPAILMPTTMSDPAWVSSPDVSLMRGNLMVLSNGPAQTASAVWPTVFNPNGKAIAFDATLSGGNGQAEGITMAFLRGSTPLPAGGLVGGGLGKLGFGGLDGVALALDLKKQAGDPASTFLGIADGEQGESLHYLQTADPGIRLRGAVVHIQFSSKDGVVTVLVNGRTRLTRTMTLPSEARLAFTGSTGVTTWQRQTVSNLSVGG